LITLSPLASRNLKNLPRAKARFIEPMYAKAVETLPEGSEWIYEIKLDGYRALAGKASSE
jgi:ATP-dependent DNA ligase